MWNDKNIYHGDVNIETKEIYRDRIYGSTGIKIDERVTGKTVVTFNGIGKVNVYLPIEGNTLNGIRTELIYPFKDNSGKFGIFTSDAGRPHCLELIKTISPSYISNYVLEKLNLYTDNNTVTKSSSFSPVLYNLIDVMPSVAMTLKPTQRLELLEKIHEIITSKKFSPFIKNYAKRTIRHSILDNRTGMYLRILGTYVAWLVKLDNSEEETHAIEDYFYYKAFQIDLLFGNANYINASAVTTSNILYSCIANILRNSSDEEYRFFDAPLDRWDAKGYIRCASAVSLATFMAKRAIDRGYADSADYNITNEYREYIGYIHRTTKVFDDKLTIKYIGNNDYAIPSDAEELSNKEAIDNLSEMERTTQWPAMKFEICSQLMPISKATDAAIYFEKINTLANNEGVEPMPLFYPNSKWYYKKSERTRFLITISVCLVTLLAFFFNFFTNQAFIEALHGGTKIAFKIIIGLLIFGWFYLAGDYETHRDKSNDKPWWWWTGPYWWK